MWKLLMAASLAVIFLTGYQIMDCEWVCCAIVLQGHSYSPLPTHFAVCHCADREDLRMTQQEFEGLPLQSQLQLLAATIVCALSGLKVSGVFKAIEWADDPK